MNTSTKSFRVSAGVLAAGGLCWVAKFVVIAATDGALSGLPDTITSILYIAAVTMMALGLSAVVVTGLAGRHPALRVLGGIGGLALWAVTYMVLEGIAQGIVGDTDPAWVGEEVGIVLTGAVLMTVGLMLARPKAPRLA